MAEDENVACAIGADQSAETSPLRRGDEFQILGYSGRLSVFLVSCPPESDRPEDQAGIAAAESERFGDDDIRRMGRAWFAT